MKLLKIIKLDMLVWKYDWYTLLWKVALFISKKTKNNDRLVGYWLDRALYYTDKLDDIEEAIGTL